MSTLIEKYYGKKVRIVLRFWLGTTLKGVLSECDGTFVLLKIQRSWPFPKEKQEEVLIPMASILDIFFDPLLDDPSQG